MHLKIVQISGELPAELESLRAQASAEGYRMLDQLVSDWVSGAMRFDRPGEQYLMAWVGERLVGVGGISRNPANPAQLRMRRFYVLPEYRRRSVAKTLAEALLKTVAPDVAVVVNAGTAVAPPFWEALGFEKVQGGGVTHEKRRNA